jgi:hypothetical protein
VEGFVLVTSFVVGFMGIVFPGFEDHFDFNTENAENTERDWKLIPWIEEREHPCSP